MKAKADRTLIFFSIMIQVVNRALDILELLGKDRNKFYTLREIADNLNLNHSTCANIIKTLIIRRYIEKSSTKQGYKLGPKTYYLTGNFSLKKELIRASEKPMKVLREKLNESCILVILNDDMRITLRKEVSTQELQVVSNEEEKNAYMTATGRIILACMSQNERQMFVQKFGLPKSKWEGIENEIELFQELDKIKAKQIAIHFDGEYIAGIGVPIYKNDSVIASLGVYLPEVRFSNRFREVIFMEMGKIAKIISKEISNSGTNL